MNYIEVFRNNLKDIREKKGYTQEELANLVSVRRETIIRYESNINIPTVYMAFKIAHFLNCNITDIWSYDRGFEKKEGE